MALNVVPFLFSRNIILAREAMCVVLILPQDRDKDVLDNADLMAIYDHHGRCSAG
jgi:hypothetical protein